MVNITDSLIDQLDFLIGIKKKNNRVPSLYTSQEDFVKQNGQFFTGQKYPKKYSKGRGEKKLCYTNAFNLVQRFPELIYVEGFGMSKNVPFPIQHAFCVNSEGSVVDPTWDNQEESIYFGVKFNWDYVVETILRTKHYGIIDNWYERFPLVVGKVGHQKEDFYHGK